MLKHTPCRRCPAAPLSRLSGLSLLAKLSAFDKLAKTPGVDCSAMNPDVTPAIDRALQAARRYAHARGGAAVGMVDLLHGLLEEEEGRAAALVSAAGLDPAAYRAATGVPPAAAGDLDLDAEASAALRAARELALELSGERTVASEALLLALLRADDTLRRVLGPYGLNAARLEADLLALRLPPLQLDDPIHLADTTEQVGVSRVLDASANRAREALRVLEDCARFVLDDAALTGELKQLRHDLTAALSEWAPDLLEARDTDGDVGTALATPTERHRGSLLDVVRANGQRLQEALRSLEEFGKVRHPRLGEAVERLRYRSYTLERALVLGSDARSRLQQARLYVLVSAASCLKGLEWTIAQAAAGGADVVQLREKNISDRELLERARRVRESTRRAGVLFILNDRPDVARLVGADGVHLGQDDLPVREARRILGPEALIGVSTHTVEQVRQAVLDGASYIGVGPTFASATKDFGELAGVDLVRRALAETSLPAFVIGGVNLQTIGAAVAAGARRVAVAQAIAASEDPRGVAAALTAALNAT
jgi:thiamine-phosphate pyrophosphorylase